MKILILSKEGNGVSLGWRLRQEGHDVTMWIRDPSCQKVGDGFVTKTSNWLPLKKESQLIIFDFFEMGEVSESLKKEGFVVWGGNKWSDEIELDRGKGQALFKEVGMKTSPSKEFNNLDQGIQFVQANPKRYVVKPSGSIQEEKSLTYVGKEEDASDMVAILRNYKSRWASMIDKFEIQEVKKGIEVAVGGFFNGKDFVEPILVNFEHKKLMPGNIGPASGEMGTSAVWMKKNRIYKETIGRCVKKLAENKYVGYFDINCIVENNIVWPLEPTCRFGYPTIDMKLESIKGNLGNYMLKIAKGELTAFNIFKPYTVCVVIANPPYPLKSEELHKKYSEGQEIIFSTKSRIGYWPSECSLEEEKWIISGETGYSLVVVGTGDDLGSARKEVYARIDKVTLANSFWRNDIGLHTEDNLKTLNRIGWFKS